MRKSRSNHGGFPRRTFALCLVILAGFCAVGSLWAQTEPAGSPDIQALLKRIEDLERKVRELQGNPVPATPAPTNELQQLKEKVVELESLQAASAAAAEKRARLYVGGGGVLATTPTTNFSVQLRALIQVDSRTFIDDPNNPGNDGFLLRRARPILQGRVFEDFDYTFSAEFEGGSGGQVTDAWINYRLEPGVQFRVGRFKTPIGLELLQPDQYGYFNERSMATDLVPVRDLGLTMHGSLWESAFTYAVGIFNGVADGANSSGSDFDNGRSYVGRVFFQPLQKAACAPLRGLGLGVSGNYEVFDGSSSQGLPSSGYQIPAKETFFQYSSGVLATDYHWRLSPQASWTYGPFSFIGEYVISDQAVVNGSDQAGLRHTAWHLAAGWLVTGEKATFNGVSPLKPFNPATGHWGALETVVRVDRLKIDGDAFPIFADPASSADAALEWSVGLNWFLNRNIRLNASFSRVTFEGGGGPGDTPPASVTQKPANTVFTRVQLAF